MTKETESFIAGLLIGLFLAFMLTMILGVDKWHDRTCQEQFGQAVTASDSLSVIVQDSYCNTELDR